MLNVGRLRVLRELYHRKTLSAVAEALSYSTSAVSQQVRLLEKEIGVALVEPAGRRLQLTPQGLTLVAHAEKILDMLERAEADVSASLEQVRGTVKIAAFQTAALTFLPRAVLELGNLHPDMSLEFHQGEPEETLPALQSGEYDLVIAEAYPGMPAPSFNGIVYQTLFEDPLWLAINEELYSTLDPATGLIGQLSETGWAVESLESVPRAWVIDECRRNGFEPRIVCQTEDLSVQLRFVETGLAVAVLPSLALAEASTHVRRAPTGLSIQKREILAAYREASTRKASLVAVLGALRRANDQ